MSNTTQKKCLMNTMMLRLSVGSLRSHKLLNLCDLPFLSKTVSSPISSSRCALGSRDCSSTDISGPYFDEEEAADEALEFEDVLDVLDVLDSAMAG